MMSRGQPMKWLLLFLCLPAFAAAGEKSVRVFVGLCDNATQGIVPVGKAIGDGDDPDGNLYWGCADGFGHLFKTSKRWTLQQREVDPSRSIMRRLSLRHVSGDVAVVAEAWRGSKLADCFQAFERAAASGEHDLVVFIGHNPLMDGKIPEAAVTPGNKTQVIALCCQSDAWFAPRLDKLGCRRLLTTRHNMYPGAFLVHAAIEFWRVGGDENAVRLAAAKAYAKNQGIGLGSAERVFTPGPAAGK